MVYFQNTKKILRENLRFTRNSEPKREFFTKHPQLNFIWLGPFLALIFEIWKFRGCLDEFFSSLNFCHSISITHHSSLIFSHSFGNIIFIFITQFFHTIHGSYTCQPVQCFFFFSTQLTEANIIKKKKKKLNGQPRKRKEKKKKKTQTANANPGKEKEKKKNSKGGQKLRLWVPYVCLITILPLSYELWKLKTAKSCFQFP